MLLIAIIQPNSASAATAAQLPRHAPTNKKLLALALVLLAGLAIPLETYPHSGNIDKFCGHRDRKLGGYHYHYERASCSRRPEGSEKAGGQGDGHQQTHDTQRPAEKGRGASGNQVMHYYEGRVLVNWKKGKTPEGKAIVIHKVVHPQPDKCGFGEMAGFVSNYENEAAAANAVCMKRQKKYNHCPHCWDGAAKIC